jgi:hypothetical protein
VRGRRLFIFEILISRSFLANPRPPIAAARDRDYHIRVARAFLSPSTGAGALPVSPDIALQHKNHSFYIQLNSPIVRKGGAFMALRRAKSMAIFGVVTLTALADLRVAPVRAGAPPSPPPQLQCYSVADTRREIAEHKLADPFPSMQAAGVLVQAEPLTARLCRSGDVFIYEISLLRRDGHIVKTLVDAASGKPRPPRLEAKP